ncbi:MAG: serine protease [Clostridia bacterium]|nr:serine protease [Clostridia bacterium]
MIIKKNTVFKIILLMVMVFFISSFFKTTDIETIKNSVVMVRVFDKDDNLISTGSGFCAYDSDYVFTNFHVIEGGYKIKVITDDMKEIIVDDILIFNSLDDLAMLKGDFKLDPLKVANSFWLNAGDEITAIGSPMGQLNTVSKGIISNADNSYAIRITAPISPGSSGGPIINEKGEVVGVTFASYDSVMSQNINYAITSNMVSHLYKKYKNDDFKVVSLNEEEYVPNPTNAKTIAALFKNGTYTTYSEDAYDEPDELLKYCNENEYLKTENISDFYYLTNKLELFNKAIEKYAAEDIKETYAKMSIDEKYNIIYVYEDLLNFDSYSCEISPNIPSWSIGQFILEFDLMQAYELAVFVEAVKGCASTKEIAEYLNNTSLYYDSKIMILKLLDPRNDTYDKDIMKYLAKNNRITYAQEVELLNYLGLNEEYYGKVN